MHWMKSGTKDNINMWDHIGSKKRSPLLLVSSPEFPLGWATKEMLHFIIKQIEKNLDIVRLTET